MKKNRVLKFLILFLVISFPIIGQNAQNKGYSISGFIYDAESGESLIGANLFIKELSRGASSNISGYFVIPDLPTGVYNLVCSYIGYNDYATKIQIQSDKEVHLKIELTTESIKTEEVVVSDKAERIIDKLYSKPVSQIELSPTQINKIPKMVEADLLRALQTLPGITALSDFSSALYVRGGTPDQNLYMIDGSDVYNPEHAFGIFSTFNTNAIKKVDISKGGFGAEYGGRLSSVLDVTNLDGNRNNTEAVFNLSLLSASTTIQTPIGSIGSLSGSLRRTYIDQTYAKWIDEIPAYYFYDGNLKAYFDFDRRNKLSVSFFNSRDDLDFKLDKNAKQSLGFLYDWGNTTGSVNWKHIFNTKLFSSFWFTASRFKSNFNFGTLQLQEENLISDYTMKASLEYYFSKQLNLKFGAEQKLLHEMYDQSYTEQRIFVDNSRQLSAAYFSADWQPVEDLTIQGGLRVYYFNSDTSFVNWEPRFTAKYRLTDNSSLKFAAGVYHQYINRIPRLFFSSIWTTANKYNKESSADHFIFGYQREIMNVWEFEIETYYKKYNNLYQFNTHTGTDIKPGYYDENNRPVYTSTNNIFHRGDGESYGAEIMIKKDVGDLNGWISYSWSRTNYVFDKINQSNYFMPRHNRSSVVNAVLNADIGTMLFGLNSNSTSKWNLGINFIYASGQPITVPSSAYYTGTLPDWENSGNDEYTQNSYNLYPGKINSFSLPDYIRMDLSLTYEKKYDGWSLSPYLQVINLGNRQNVWFIEYEDKIEENKITQEVSKVNMLPLLPSIGVTIKF